MEALKAQFPDLAFTSFRKLSSFGPATMRDGIKIYTNVFQPASSDDSNNQVPAIIAWSPYGKDSKDFSYDHMGPFRCGIALDQTSGYEKFEAPDPADWCARGYTVINPDARGAGFSEGDVAQWGDQEAFDLHDLVNWVSKQPWCSGSIAKVGNPWLAIVQINVASQDPHPALNAIAP